MRVIDILDAKGREVVALLPGASILEAARVLAERHIGALVIMDGAEIVGIISERDIVRFVKDGGDLESPISTIMSTDVMICVPEDELRAIAEVMTRQRIRHLPVVEDRKVMGIVSIGDVVKARLEDLEHERDHLVSYVHGTRPRP